MIRNILYITIFTAFIVLLWIVFSIKYTLDTSTISQQTSIQISPIPPTFDQTTLQELETRSKVNVNLSDPSPYTSSTTRQASGSSSFNTPSVPLGNPSAIPKTSPNKSSVNGTEQL